MATRRHVRYLAVAMVAFLTSGCLWAPELDRLRKDIESQLPGSHFKKQITLSLGPVTLALIRGIVGIAPHTEEVRPLLREVRSVKLALYEAEGRRPYGALAMPPTLRKGLREGWQLAAKLMDEDAISWVMYRAEGDIVTHLFIVVVNEDRLVLVRLEGRLDRLVQRVVRTRLHASPAGS
jgi:hypothetical protein